MHNYALPRGTDRLVHGDFLVSVYKSDLLSQLIPISMWKRVVGKGLIFIPLQKGDFGDVENCKLPVTNDLFGCYLPICFEYLVSKR